MIEAAPVAEPKLDHQARYGRNLADCPIEAGALRL
jgi:hypothetical protein